MKKIIILIVLLSMSRAWTNPHYVATNGLHVSPFLTRANAATNPADAVSIAGDGATIIIDRGRYVANKTAGIGANKSIVITSLWGAAETIIDGNGQERRCFVISNTGTTAQVYGLTITNFVFSAAGGAAFYVYPGTLHLDSCVIAGNMAFYGAGVWAASAATAFANVTVTNSEFIGNISLRVNNYSGAAIHFNIGSSTTSTFRVDNTLFYENSSITGGYGGAVFLAGSITGSFFNCVFERNSVSGGVGPGGAICADYASGCFLSSCHFLSNSTGTGAGGAYSGPAGTTIENCIFEGNTNAGQGGALRCGGGTIRNTRVANNRASGHGGGIWCGDNTVVSHCTIIGNTASGNGGGIAGGGLIKNCLIAHNTADSGASWAGGYSGNAFLVNCTVVSNHSGYVAGGVSRPWSFNSIIYYNTCATPAFSNYWVNDTTVRPWTNCITAPDPATVTIGGTNCTTDPPMFGVAPNQFKPVKGSPAINVGVNQDWMKGAKDLNRHTRIGEGIVDIGAYEYHPPGTVIVFQ